MSRTSASWLEMSGDVMIAKDICETSSSDRDNDRPSSGRFGVQLSMLYVQVIVITETVKHTYIQYIYISHLIFTMNKQALCMQAILVADKVETTDRLFSSEIQRESLYRVMPVQEATVSDSVRSVTCPAPFNEAILTAGLSIDTQYISSSAFKTRQLEKHSQVMLGIRRSTSAKRLIQWISDIALGLVLPCPGWSS